MAMECTPKEELDNLLDDIICWEDKVAEKAFAEGIQKGSKNASLNAYHLGFHYGLEVGSEVGYYEGLTNTLLKLHRDNALELPDKVLKILEKLQVLLENFPHFNCPNTFTTERRQEIASFVKQLCSLLKFDGMLPENGLSF